MVFNEFNDYYLVYLIKNHNEKALNLLILKYSALIKKIIYKYHLPDIFYDDYYMEGVMVLEKCVKLFNDSYPFYSYFSLCFDREIRRIKDKTVKDYLTYEQLINEPERLYEDANNFFNYYRPKEDLKASIIYFLKQNYSLHEIALLLNEPENVIYYQYKLIKKDIKDDYF